MQPVSTQLVVVGGGPGGYAAAFYAADKGLEVILVEKEPLLGGTCLRVGCIPSKALLHAAKVITEARESAHRGIAFGEPQIDRTRLREWKQSIVTKLAGGIQSLARARGVQVWHGRAHFEGSDMLRVETEDGQRFVRYQYAIIATGSQAAMPKAFDLGNPRVMTSTEALEVEEIPGDLLIVGGGYIGMELGTVYATLGSRVVMVEALPQILTGADPDLVRPVLKYAERAFREVRLNTKVAKMATAGKQIRVILEGPQGTKEELYDRVLVAVGRVPNCYDLGLETTRVQRDERGFIKVNARQQTNDPHIYAIGDVV
ncbi:MAG: NAD(P)/FAD-dependent oxidoreductase, partial [Verrucomicrobiae bacterium]|nr:NAD(P)/FAD-dependent oxidoreductase [Verrucomicrobiae bacterium]